MEFLRRVASYFQSETRMSSWDLIGRTSLPGIVNTHTAENLCDGVVCVGAISSTLGSLPAFIYRTVNRGREIVDQHPIARLIASGPNQHQTWADWVEWTMASVLLRGNSISEIVSDGRGAVVALKPIPFEWCNISMLPNGKLAYDIVEPTHAYGGTGRPRRLLQSEVFHLRDRTDDGLIGRSRLQRAAAVVSTGLSIQQFADSLYTNSVVPSGSLEVDGKLSDEARERLTTSFRQGFSGPANAARALILDQGLHWKSISITPEDAEFLASRRFTVEELARLYNVPPPIAGDLSHGSFANVEHLIRWFGQSTLTPWCAKVESEFSRSVLTDTSIRLELDLSGLMRGAPTERWANHAIAIEHNILSVDEIREQEGYGPRAAPAPVVS